MPNNVGGNETSRLIKDIGSYTNMMYFCPGGSGTQTSNAMSALMDNFGYARTEKYQSVTSEELVYQLNQHWPVIMRGVDPSAGHAWVVDGYMRTRAVIIHNPGTYYEYETTQISDYYLRCNWGWDGTNNAWYLFDDMTPGLWNFNSYRQMIINIHP